MSTTLLPNISRKKYVERTLSDSFRVISIDAELQHEKVRLTRSEPSCAIIERPPRERQYPTDNRYHKPHPYDCGFLRHNVKWLNEPICVVHTRKVTGPIDYRPSAEFFTDEQLPPIEPMKTVSMQDFVGKFDSAARTRVTRYASNPNVCAATGIVPGTELEARRRGGQPLFESISYEHIYNSRKDSNYPIRSKRHGSFVWKSPRQAVGAEAPEHIKCEGIF